MHATRRRLTRLLSRSEQPTPSAHVTRVAILTLATCAAITSAADATTITGSIYFNGGFSSNGYDPMGGAVPAGSSNSMSNTVSVDSGATFGFQDQYNRDSATFSGSSLTLTDSVLSVGASAWQQTFVSSTPTFFTGITLASSNYNPGLSFSNSGNALTVNWAGEYSKAPANFSAQFTLAPTGASTLTSSSVAMMGNLYHYSYDVAYTGPNAGSFIIPLIGIDDIVGVTPMGITPEYTTDFGTAFNYVAKYALALGENIISFDSRNAPIEGPVGIDNGSYVTTIDPPIPGNGTVTAVPEPMGVIPLLIGLAALAMTKVRKSQGRRKHRLTPNLG